MSGSIKCYNKSMGKKIKKFLKILLILLFFLILTKTFFKLVYFPSHPTVISKYQQRNGHNATLDGNKIKLLVPSGCFDSCWGKEVLISCKNYSEEYYNCSYNCYSYVYNNCSSSKLGFIAGLLIR